MKIHTMSIVVGSTACNAKCPYCVSKTTPGDGMLKDAEAINYKNLHVACKLADRNLVPTVLLTGKGEPTLYPDLIDNYLRILGNHNFPFIELQTNGITIWENKPGNVDAQRLKKWSEAGMTTISVSIVHPDNYLNKHIYRPKELIPMDLADVIMKIKAAGMTVRLSCIMLNGYIDSPNGIKGLIQYCQCYGVKQLTIRPMHAPENNENETTKWIDENHLTKAQALDIENFLEREGNRVLELSHGGVVYDVYGQNVCYTNALTTNKSSEDIRQIIFFPDGTISHDWKYTGAVLL